MHGMLSGTNEGNAVVLFLTFSLAITLWATNAVSAVSADSGFTSVTSWSGLVAQAEALGLPTRFLRQIPPNFFVLEFDDLHQFAAEYHPGEHRMVLNRTLSFNAAGGALRPLARMTHGELATFYHEFFHAYVDFISSAPELATRDPEATRLLTFARDQQRCRYQRVLITPVVQRKSAIESRILTDRESWEALNETWAVFVGWAVWTRLELQAGRKAQQRQKLDIATGWLNRLKKADQNGELVGYYEPEDPAERAVTHKRYLAPPNRVSPREVAILLEVVLGETADLARRSAAIMEQNRPPSGDAPLCQG